MIKLPEKCPTAFYKVIYDQCGGFVDCQANAQTIWNAAITEVQRLNATAQPVRLPTTRLWAGKVDCYSKEDVISMLKSLGLEVSE